MARKLAAAVDTAAVRGLHQGLCALPGRAGGSITPVMLFLQHVDDRLVSMWEPASASMPGQLLPGTHLRVCIAYVCKASDC